MNRAGNNHDGVPRQDSSSPFRGCGEGGRTFCGKQMPIRWTERRRQGALYLTFEGAEAEIVWRCGSGGTRSQRVSAHQFCIIPLNFPHICEWKRAADIAVVHLRDASSRANLFGVADVPVVGDFLPLARLDTCLWSLSAILHDLCRSGERPPASFVEGVGIALASRIVEQHFQGPRNGSAALPRLPGSVLRQVTEYVEMHLREPVTVADLAKHVAIGVDHFARLLKNTTGMSPLQFLLKCRVEKALELLRTGEFRVAEAACEVGFYDQSHFDRHCRKFFGFPPKVVMRSGGSSSKLPESSKISVA